VLPPDVNESQLRFTVEAGKGVRFGLTAIKNVGEGAIASLLEVRKKQGRIASLGALCGDLDLRLVNKRVFESLVKAGAFDSLSPGTPSLALRPKLMASIDAACAQGARAQDDRERGQGGLFFEEAHAQAPSADGFAAINVPAWTETEQLAFEKETLGLYWSGHPVDRYASALRDLGAKTVSDLADAQPSGSRADAWGPGGPKPVEPDTSVGGIVAAVRPLKTRKGDRMAVFTLEDAQGNVEIVVFPETFQRNGSLVETGTLVLVRGKLERDDETTRIIASEIAPIETVRERLAREVAIHLRVPARRDLFEALGEIFSRHRGDRRVSFEMELSGAATPMRVRADVSAQIRVRPSSALIAEVEQVVGAGSVELR
jgi:DNA polymerase-3 subunit alpha